MKTKTELLAELEQAQKRIAELENTSTNSKKAVEKAHTVEELHTSKKWFTTLFRSNPVPVGITRKTDYRIVDVNDAWSILTGYSREEALGRTSTELGLAKPQTLQTVRDWLQTQGEIRQNEILLYTRTGQERHVLISSEQIDIDGESYFLNNLLDVTEQRLAEDKLYESEARLKGFLDAAPDAMVIVNTDGKIIFANLQAENLFGYKHSELFQAELEKLIPERFKKAHIKNIARFFQKPQTREMGSGRELFILHKDGHEVMVEISLSHHQMDAERVVLCAIRDITERRQAEQKIRESEEIFRTFIEQSYDGIMLSDAQGKIIEWNPALAQTSGLERNVTLGMNAWDVQFQMMTPEKRSQITVEQLKTGMQNVMKEERHPKFNAPGEFEIQTTHGERKILSQTSFPIFSQTGYRLGAIVRDITARKQADEKLRESEARFTTAFFTNPAPQSILSLVTGRVLEVNESTCRLFGYSREELIGAEPGTLNLWAEPNEQIAALEELKTSGHLLPRVVTIRKKSGETRNIIFTAEQITWKAEPCLITSSLDITERKQAENALEQTRNTLEQAQKIAHMGSFEYIAATQTTVWSEEEYRIYGVDPTKPSPAYEDMLRQMIHPDDADLLHEVFTKAMQNNSIYELEHRILRPDGSIRWVHDRAIPYLDAEGKLERYIGITLDITERKEAEQKVLISETLLRQVLESTQNATFAVDRNYRLLLNNQRHQQVLVETGGHPFQAGESVLPPDYLPEVLELWRNLYDRAFNGEEFKWETEWLYADGLRHVIESNFSPLRDDTDNITGALVVIHDITERKLAEKNLRESEHRYTTLFQKSSISVFVLKLPEVVIADVNEGAEKLTGYSREELLGKTAAELGLISKSQRTEAIAKFERDKSLTDNEMQIVTKSGEKRVILISTNPIEINGQPFAFTSMQDITERKRAEQALLESNEKYRLLSEELEERVNQRTAEVQDLYDNAPAGYHSLDANGYFLKINQTELNWLGYSRDEVIGHPFSNFVTEKGLATFKENFQAFKQRGWLQDVEIEFLCKSGTILHALVNATAIKDENGNYLMSRSTVFDITARKQAERALRESEANLQNFLDTAHDLIQSLDEHGKFLYVNNAWRTTLGYSLEEALHLSMFDVIAPEHHATCREMLNQLVVGKEPERVEVIFKTKQGQSVVVEGHVNSRKNANGQIATNGIFRDITMRKKADEALKASETKYRHLFENMNEGFSLQEIITDENGQPIDFRYLDANSMFEHHAGIASQKVIGKTAREVFSQIDPRSIQNYGKVALTGEPISLEYFSTSVNRYMSVRAFSPKHGQFATIFEDITERKQAEDKLNESYARLDFANRELERASRAKDEFLANMSHELRTPLNAIIGLSDSMLEISFNDFTPKQQNYLNTIRESGQHLLNLINDVLDLAKVGAGQLVLETHAVDLDTVCQASLRMIKQLAAHKNIDVHFDIDQNIYSINADERRLKQMLVNLLNNAVKFTPPTGEIGLEVRGDHIKQQVRFTVWDTGIGISKEDQTHLFQPFMQVNSSLSREVGGTGLGLALVSEMARLHGGTVSLESEPGKGSRFSFTLPWSDSEAIVSPQKTGSTGGLSLPPTAIHDKKPTILLVEDTETSVMAARDYLEAKGYLVEVARNGQDGIALARKIKPDLILMDVQMPVMDGLEAMRRLRAQSEFQHTPIIALTAYAMQEDRDRCLAAGATDYMSKPYKLSLLVQKIEHLLEDVKNK